MISSARQNAVWRPSLNTFVRTLSVVGIAITMAGCKLRDRQEVTNSVPNDYRLRHPITIGQGTRSLDIHVGAGRGGLNPTQRAEVLAFAHTWRREATGGITIERPVSGPADRASLETLQQTLSILVGAGIPNHGIGIRPYRAPPAGVVVIRMNYPQVAAHVGPCGTWPDDLGPTYGRQHFENRQYYNLGCATQRNMAAMVAHKEDLVQPRAEGPSYTAKRTFGVEKWRKGESPATTYPDSNKGAISDLGK